MKAAKMLLGLALVFTLVLVARADDKGKEKTVKGTITCGKCDLKLVKACHTVIKSGETVYWFDKDSNKKYHTDICKEGKKGTVTGTVTKDGDKSTIAVSKLEYEK